MNYGNMYGMNRGMGGQPQPQRQGGNNRRNRNNFRNNSRFDPPQQGGNNRNQNQNFQNQNFQNQNQNRNNVQNKEVKQPIQQQPIEQQPPQQQPQQQQQQQQQQQTPKPLVKVENTPQKPVNVVQQQIKPVNTPIQQAKPVQVPPKPINVAPAQKPAVIQQQPKPMNTPQQQKPVIAQQQNQQPKPNIQQNQQQKPNIQQQKPNIQQQKSNVPPLNNQQMQKPVNQLPVIKPVMQQQNQQQNNVPKNVPKNINTINQGQQNNQNKQSNNSNQMPLQNQNQNQNQHQNPNPNQGQGNLNAQNKIMGNQNPGQGNMNNFNKMGGSNNSLNKMGGMRGQQGQGGPPGQVQGGMRPPRRFGPNDKSGGAPGGSREEHFIMSKLKEISGSTVDLPAMEQVEQKFSGRNRLYIGNLTNDISEQDLLDIFSPYGETSELFINKDKNFAFIRIDYKANAEKAKREVDGRMRRGRPLRVRFAPHNSAIKVKNLTPFVSNELLYRSFEVFGKIERAQVKVDDRGKSLGEGIVEFSRKAGAMGAIRHCTERCYFLTGSLRPVVVESFDEVDEADGYTEKSLPRKGPDFIRAREVGPRFAEAGSFEHEYGTRWKQLFELYKQKEEALTREMHTEEEKLEAQMEYAKYEHETELLRDQLRQREQDRERKKRSWEMAERQVEEERVKQRESILLQEEDMAQRMRHQEDELRRRQQENTLFMQAQQLNRILDEQEQGMGGGAGGMGGGRGGGGGYESPLPPMDSKRGFDGPLNIGNSMQMDSGYMEYDSMGGHGHMGFDDGMGRWDSRQDDFPNKRRRY